jgi:hypothetical protein
MINDILDYTRLMENKLKVNPIFLNLDNLLKVKYKFRLLKFTGGY